MELKYANYQAALHEYLSLVATILETANRVGAPTDQPEGSQYIMLSHTLAMQIACKLRDFATPVYVTVVGPPQPGERRNQARPEQ